MGPRGAGATARAIDDFQEETKEHLMYFIATCTTCNIANLKSALIAADYSTKKIITFFQKIVPNWQNVRLLF